MPEQQRRFETIMENARNICARTEEIRRQHESGREEFESMLRVSGVELAKVKQFLKTLPPAMHEKSGAARVRIRDEIRRDRDAAVSVFADSMSPPAPAARAKRSRNMA